jgi:hypothetical protein
MKEIVMPVRRTVKEDSDEDQPWSEVILEDDLDIVLDEPEKPKRKKPKRKSSRVSQARGGAKASRRVVDSEEDSDAFVDEDEVTATRSSTVQRGWAAASKAASAATGGGKFFKVDPKPQLVKFISPDGVLTYNQHWVDEAPTKKKSFVCCGDGCPICAAGNKPSPRYVFSVLNLSLDVPIVQRMDAAPTLLKQIEPLHVDKRTGPMDKLFWSISATKGSGNRNVWSLVPVKPRDIEEDWDIEEDFALDLADDAVPVEESDIFIPEVEELEEIASYI